VSAVSSAAHAPWVLGGNVCTTAASTGWALGGNSPVGRHTGAADRTGNHGFAATAPTPAAPACGMLDAVYGWMGTRPSRRWCWVRVWVEMTGAPQNDIGTPGGILGPARPSCLINIDIWRRRPQVLVDFKRIHAASLLALPQCSSSAGACNPEVSEYSLLPDFVFCLGSDEVSAGLSHGAELFEALKQRVRSRRPL
jgi:hypothetical protein